MATTLKMVVDAMRDHDAIHAPGSESNQWQGLVGDDARVLNDDLDIEVNDKWAAFWLAVAARDWAEAERFGDINPDWREEDEPTPACPDCDARPETRTCIVCQETWTGTDCGHGEEPEITGEYDCDMICDSCRIDLADDDKIEALHREAVDHGDQATANDCCEAFRIGAGDAMDRVALVMAHAIADARAQSTT